MVHFIEPFLMAGAAISASMEVIVSVGSSSEDPAGDPSIGDLSRSRRRVPPSNGL